MIGYESDSGLSAIIIDGFDSFLPGAESFLKSIPEKDMSIFLTSRTDDYKEKTELFLKKNGIKYDHIIFDAPYGERILINDDKPSGLCMSMSVRKERDAPLYPHIILDKSL